MCSPGWRWACRLTVARTPADGASPKALGSPRGRGGPAVSLAPGEQRALAGIEDALRRSDPSLAATLTTFTPPLAVGLGIWLARAFRRRVARGLAVALVLPVACVIAMSWLVISQPSQPGCPPGMHASSPGQTGAARHDRMAGQPRGPSLRLRDGRHVA